MCSSVDVFLCVCLFAYSCSVSCRCDYMIACGRVSNLYCRSFSLSVSLPFPISNSFAGARGGGLDGIYMVVA